MTCGISRIYDETRSWGTGPLDAEERAAAAVLCDLAIRAGGPDVRADATQALDMCGLLHREAA